MEEREERERERGNSGFHGRQAMRILRSKNPLGLAGQNPDNAGLAERLPSMLKALGLIPALHTPGVVCAYNLSHWERKIEGPESQCQ